MQSIRWFARAASAAAIVVLAFGGEPASAQTQACSDIHNRQRALQAEVEGICGQRLYRLEYFLGSITDIKLKLGGPRVLRGDGVPCYILASTFDVTDYQDRVRRALGDPQAPVYVNVWRDAPETIAVTPVCKQRLVELAAEVLPRAAAKTQAPAVAQPQVTQSSTTARVQAAASDDACMAEWQEYNSAYGTLNSSWDSSRRLAHLPVVMYDYSAVQVKLQEYRRRGIEPLTDSSALRELAQIWRVQTTNMDIRVRTQARWIACMALARANELSGAAKTQAPAASMPGAITIGAARFVRSLNVATGGPNNAYGTDVLLNGPPYDERPNVAEYEFEAAAAGSYRLLIEYAAAGPRPVRILINGQLAIPAAAVASTGCWGPECQRLMPQGDVNLRRGSNLLRVESNSIFPHLRGFVFQPVNQVVAARGTGAAQETSRGSRSKVIAGNGKSAMDCVRLVEVTQTDPKLLGTGGRKLVNNCSDLVEVTWCYEDNECSQDRGNQWTISPGYAYPVSAERAVRFAACHGRDTVAFERGTSGTRFICRAPEK